MPKFVPSHKPAKFNYGSIESGTPVFRCSIEYINNSNTPLQVVHRNNLAVPVRAEKCYDYTEGTFIVRSTWFFSGFEHMRATVTSINETLKNQRLSKDELDTFRKLIEMGSSTSSPSYFRKAEITIDREFTLRELIENGVTYVHDLDVQILTSPHFGLTPHPYNSQTVSLERYYNFSRDHNVSGFFMDIVDNDAVAGKRFVYAGSKLLEIEPRVDAEKQSGVYCCHMEKMGLTGPHVMTNFYTFEEAEVQLGVYANRNDAVTGGNPEMVNKIEVERLKAEALALSQAVEQSKFDTAIVKEQSERQKQEYQTQLDTMRLEFEEKKQKMEERKHRRADAYDERSTARKDSSDILKLSVAVAGFAFGVFGLIYKK